jgi:hypothetical protein
VRDESVRRGRSKKLGKAYIRPLIFNLIFNAKLGSLGTSATEWPIVPAPGDYDDGEFGGMKTGRGNRSTRRKPAPAPLCPPQIPLNQTRVWTRAAAMGSQRLTAWAMARPIRQLNSLRIQGPKLVLLTRQAEELKIHAHRAKMFLALLQIWALILGLIINAAARGCVEPVRSSPGLSTRSGRNAVQQRVEECDIRKYEAGQQ